MSDSGNAIVKPGWSASQEESWKRFEEDTKSKPVFCICVKRAISRGGPSRVEHVDVFSIIPSEKERMKAHAAMVHKWKNEKWTTVESCVGPIISPGTGLMGHPVTWRAEWKPGRLCPCSDCLQERRQAKSFKVVVFPSPFRRPSVPVIDLVDDDIEDLE
jgi:hypothetical protein